MASLCVLLAVSIIVVSPHPAPPWKPRPAKGGVQGGNRVSGILDKILGESSRWKDDPPLRDVSMSSIPELVNIGFLRKRAIAEKRVKIYIILIDDGGP